MTHSYGWEKLHTAIHSLCGQGTQAERLINAICYSIINITPENDLPEEMRAEFQEFMNEMTSVTAEGSEGNIQATINTLDEIALSRAVDKVISFYDTICRHREPH
jgi:hypothetical protein